MLNRNNDVATPDEILSNNLTYKPAVASSAWNNFSLGFTTPQYAVQSFSDTYNKSPEGTAAAGAYAALKRGNEHPDVGWGQWSVNEASNLLGQALNPWSWLIAEAGGWAVKPISYVAGALTPATSIFREPLAKVLGETASKYLPSVIGKQEQTLSAALFGKELTHAAGIGAGATLPQATIDNFDAELGKHDFLGMAKSTGAGATLGLAIGTVPFAWGILKANFNRRLGKASGFDFVPEPPSGGGGSGGAAARAVEPFESEMVMREHLANGVIDQDTFDFWYEMQQWKNSTEGKAEAAAKVQEKATAYVANHGHPVDHANHTAQFNILSDDQMQNLQSATVDQLLSDNIPEQHRTALSDFAVQVGIDDMRNKRDLLDGVRGYVDYVDTQMASKDALLASADKIVDEHLSMSHEGHEFPLTQEHIYQAAKEHGKENTLPFHIPEAVRNRIKQERSISALERRNQKLFEKYEETGAQKYIDEMRANNELIEEKKSEIEPFKSPMEELHDIKNQLLPVKPNMRQTKEYARLQDLAEVWQPAKTLLDRIKLEEDIKAQEAYRDIAKQMLAIADSNVGAMADRSKVDSYMEARTKQNVEVEHAGIADQVKESYQVPTDADTILAEQDRLLDGVTNKLSKEEYEIAKAKRTEFAKSEGIFKSMINCILGASA